MNFKEYYLLNESNSDDLDSFCLMAYPNEESINNIAKVHKLLNIEAKEIITPKKYHSTIRYFKTEKNITPFVEFLKEYKFKSLKAVSTKLDFLGDSYSMFLDSKDLSSEFNKINDWLLENGYPKSDYPKFKPHLAFCYDPAKSWIPPEIDKNDIKIEIVYDNFKLSKNHETIWKLK